MLMRWAGAARLWVVSGGYLLLLIPGFYLETPGAWRLSTGMTALVALCAWQLVLRRLGVLRDTPRSLVGSAAQGYVALRGQGMQFEGYPVFAPHRATPCLWYRYRVEQRHDRKWETQTVEESGTSFLLEDATGCCTVVPEGAEFTVHHRQTWTEADERYTLELILPGELIHVVGEFRTLGGDCADLNARRDTSELLTHWKQDMPTLVSRYDRNADGTIDLQEWETVRRDARREVDQLHRDILAQAPTHEIGRGVNGRPFIISTRDVQSMVRRFRLWAYAHAGIFLMAFSFALQL
jgi:hypothetical protein